MDISDRRSAGLQLGVLTFALLVLMIAILLSPIRLPIGASYWDTFIYIDGAYRQSLGQEIYRDFHAPVGPLNYWLFDRLQALFPSGHVVLVIQWSLMLVSLPVMLVVTWQALHIGRIAAFGVLLPFLFWSLLPFNVIAFTPFPGVDGFAYYNRHASLLLYVLVATLFFVRTPGAMIACLSATLLALAFLKINGFVAAGLLLLLAVVSRRISVPIALTTAAICLSVTAVLEVTTGVVSSYLASTFRLLTNNTGVLTQNIVLTGSSRFDVIAGSSALALYLLLRGVKKRETSLGVNIEIGRWQAQPNWFDRDWIWLGILIAANIVFESQNFGSAAFISIWPLILAIWITRSREPEGRSTVFVVLIALACLPTVTKTAHAAVRSVGTSINNVPIAMNAMQHQSPLSTKKLVLDASNNARAIYASNRQTYDAFSEGGYLPIYWMYFQHQFQVVLLQTMDEAVAAILARENETGHRYEVIDLRDFANPLVAAMGRTPARGISIGGDPYRAVLPLHDDEQAALAQTDLVLLPTCPMTPARMKLFAGYARAFEGFRRFQLSPCFEALENPKFQNN